MNIGKIRNAQGDVLLNQVYQTNSAWERLRGLLARPEPGAQQGLLIKPCNMVHTAFMRYPIDVIFMDRLGHISAMYENLKPWRIATSLGAKMVLEIRAGGIQRHNISLPSKLDWVEE